MEVSLSAAGLLGEIIGCYKIPSKYKSMLLYIIISMAIRFFSELLGKWWFTEISELGIIKE